MPRRFIILYLVFPILIFACSSVVLPGDETETPVATSTSTPVLNLEEIAQRTYTATVTSSPTETFTPTPTDTPQPTTALPTATETSPEPTVIFTQAMDTPTLQSSSEDEAADTALARILEVALDELPSRFFLVQEGTPVSLPSWAHAELGCNWLGVAGQVFNLAGDPEINLIIEAGGELEGEPVIGLALTGLESVYGPGGYEIQLADHAVASQNEVWLQVKSDSGEKLSYPIFVETFNDCNQNLILLNLIEVEEIPVPPDPNQVFLPIINNQGSE